MEHTQLVSSAKPRKARANWTDAKERAFVLYLQQHAATAGDGLNFPKRTFTSVAQHLQERFLEQTGGEKTSTACHTKWTKVHTISYLCVIYSSNIAAQG